jgi:adenylate kinase
MSERMKKIIILSGTPGTGKTTIANLLCKELNAIIIDLNKEVIENNFFTMDLDRETKIADVEKLKSHVVKKIKESELKYIIIEGHYADIIPDDLVHHAIVLRTHPETLKRRLKQKGFSNGKIRENLQAEILGDCSSHAIDSYGMNKIHELDTSNASIEDSVQKIISIVKENKPPEIQVIDWLGTLEKEGKLKEFFN